MSLDNAIIQAIKDGEKLAPEIKSSVNYKTWISKEDAKRCVICENNHGKIWGIKEILLVRPPVHIYCRCKIDFLNAIIAGTATFNNINGADWWMKHLKELPDYYISRGEARKNGWIQKQGNLGESCPGKMIFGGEYYNSNGHLPSAPGRLWYEVDINYKNGYRNTQRIVYSNDGLIFVTYDHYVTFYEII